MAFVAIAAGVGLAGAAAGAYVSNQGKQSAIGAQEKAINGLQGLNIPSLQSLASSADIQKYQQQFAEQAAIDPAYASLRTAGAGGMLSQLSSDASGNSLADQALNGEAAGSGSTISQLMEQASNELSAGATLPPSFQAELVRSGLESSGQSGLQPGPNGAGGTNIRTLLGSAGLQLQAQRQQQAEGMLSTADSALNDLASMSNQLTQSKMGRAVTAAGVGNATLPSIGLSGQDVTGMSEANTGLQNQKTLGLGNLDAQSALGNAQMWSSILGSTTSSLTSGLLGPGKSTSGWLTGNNGSAVNVNHW